MSPDIDQPLRLRKTDPMTKKPFSVGLLLFPNLTQLDMTGPFEVFKRVPGSSVHLIWKTRDPVTSDTGLTMLPTATFADCPPLDVICVPGGPGVAALMEDDEVLDFLRKTAQSARFVTSVCTGSLVLAAAGLLKGKRATSHWMSRPFLATLGATPVDERVVRDGNVITGGGVTAGIDFALSIVGQEFGQGTAEEIQLAIEYDPHPPYNAGSPRTADAALVDDVTTRSAARQDARRAIAERAAARLGLG
jgi:cyclohexyl-isocyanide hydratase